MFVEGAPALNRVRWAHSGKEIATGDSEGQVQVYDVGEVRGHPLIMLWLFPCGIELLTTSVHTSSDTFLVSLSSTLSVHTDYMHCPLQQICVPKADEWTRFVRTLAEINENRDEAEELANV